MESKINIIRHKILRKIFGVLSFSTALFVFQACYGPGPDFRLDVTIRGLIKARTTDQPVPGIKVSIEGQPQSAYSNPQGEFRIYTVRDTVYKILFEDIDSTENGLFQAEDTVIKSIDESIYLDIFLDDK